MSLEEYTQANIKRIDNFRKRGKVTDFSLGLSVVEYAHEEYIVIEPTYGIWFGYPFKTLKDAEKSLTDTKFVKELLYLYFGVDSLKNPKLLKKINESCFEHSPA